MDASLEVSPSLTCASCGSARLTWRVKRQRTAGMYGSLRMLAWQCKDCGGAWDESLNHAAAPVLPRANS